MMTQHLPRTLARLASALALVGLMATTAAADGIVAHPDQLKFPPSNYQPPRAADHRVTLSNGMVAYLVPDHTTPLVTVAVVMRMGAQLDPAGKEGLAAMTANPKNVINPHSWRRRLSVSDCIASAAMMRNGTVASVTTDADASARPRANS